MMMKETGARIVYVLLLAFCVPVATGCAITSGSTVSGGVSYRGSRVGVDILFTDDDRRMIRHHYESRRANLPPGLAKKKQLPPGLRKQIARKGHLPPGLDGDRLPAKLEKQLSRIPEGHVRIRVGADIVLMDGASRLILDVIKDVAI